MRELLVKRINSRATIPEFKTKGAAGLDLCVCLEDPNSTVVLWPGQTKRVPTGLIFAIPEGFVGRIHARSSLYFKGIDLDGVIDSDYRGEVLLQIRNSSTEKVTILSGERVAQMLIQPVAQPCIVEMDNLGETERGAGGFGSTGSK